MEQNTSQEHRDIQVRPSEIRNVNFFRFRKTGVGRIVEYIAVTLPNGEEALLYGTSEKNQFVSRVGLRISKLRNMWDYNDRNETILKACKERSDPVIFRSFKDNGKWHTYAVVTDKFTHVGHQEIYRIIEKEFTKYSLGDYEIDEFRTETRAWRTYLFDKRVGTKIGDVVQLGLRVANSVKGTSSIIFYGYSKRLACLNGMTSSDGIWSPKTTHTGEKTEIMQSVKSIVSKAVESTLGMEELMEKSMQVKIDPKRDIEMCKNLEMRYGISRYAGYYIRRQFKDKHDTLWDFVNAITWTATHEVESPTVKLRLEQLAYSLMKGGQKSVDKLLENPYGVQKQA